MIEEYVCARLELGAVAARVRGLILGIQITREVVEHDEDVTKHSGGGND